MDNRDRILEIRFLTTQVQALGSLNRLLLDCVVIMDLRGWVSLHVWIYV